jgi:hypothetical protein
MDVEQRQAGGSVIRLRANSVGLIGFEASGPVGGFDDDGRPVPRCR